MNEKDNFYHVVLQKASAIRERVNGLESTELNDAIRNATITQCLTNVNDLKHEIGSRANQIAPHDQRIYNELLNGLNQQLQEVRSQFAPKRKFAFKPKASANLLKRPSDKPASPPIKRTSTPEVEKASENLDPEPVVAGVDPGDLQKASVLKDINHELRTESNFGHVDRGILMSNSSQCIIRCALPSPKLTINNIQTSVLVAGPINGAAFVTGMSASVLIVVCRQLRMHRCRNCVVYLRCSSKPIIEDCLSIQFAPFPDEMDMAPLDGTVVDQWDQVHDFNWLKAEHSPHWSILPPEKRNLPDQWKLLQNATKNEVDEVLQELGATNLNSQDVEFTE